MKRLIIPDHLLRELCKVDGKIYSARRKSDTVQAAIGYVAGEYLYQGEAAKAHGVTRASVNAAARVIAKSWQKNRVTVIAKMIESGRANGLSNKFAMNELAAHAAGIDTSNGLFNPLDCDDSAFKLSVSLNPEKLWVHCGVATCEKTVDGELFVKKVADEGYGSECDESQALRKALFLVAASIGARMLEKENQKEQQNAGNN